MTTKFSERKPRLPQRKRAKPEVLPTFRLTERDHEIIRAVYEYRVLTTKQLSDLLFVPVDVLVPPPPNSRCLHRFKILYHAGLLQRFELPNLLTEGRRPFLYRLDKGGATLLAAVRQCPVEELDWGQGEHVGHQFLEHLLKTNDVRVAIVRSANRHGFTIEQWLDDKTLKTYQKDTVTLTSSTGRKQSAALVPDGYVHLNTGTHHYHQFLETDLSSVTISSMNWGRRTWARKVQAYIQYYRSGKYHERYHTKSMRVLTVTTGQKRLENLRAITAESGGKSRFWFTTFERILQSDVLVDPIWDVAGGDRPRSLTW